MEDETSKNELAKKRTELAVQRTILANARTFSAWIRTGLSSVLGGLAVVKFMGDNEIYRGYILLIGILFVLIGIAIYIFAFLSFRNSFNQLKKEDENTTNSLAILVMITTGMVLTAVLIMGLLVFY
ncbi:YidH family protein [Carnobacterium sp. TMP28]|uniref:YidH family protein n=1 Tax=Carnobacterium sp. TMP28 TaxID=3397060 RepID=UPI0039DFD94F